MYGSSGMITSDSGASTLASVEIDRYDTGRLRGAS
jgi:hypothetical protein